MPKIILNLINSNFVFVVESHIKFLKNYHFYVFVVKGFSKIFTYYKLQPRLT